MSTRLFIAIKPNIPTLESISECQHAMFQELRIRGIRWVKPEIMHLTLLFLGDVEESRIPTITNSLNYVSNENAVYNLTFEGIGFFGKPEAIRTIWIATKDQGETQKLYRSICKSLQDAVQVNNKRLTPHLTLARISDYVQKQDRMTISRTISSYEKRSFGISKTDRFELIKSTLTPSGPIYETVKQFILR